MLIDVVLWPVASPDRPVSACCGKANKTAATIHKSGTCDKGQVAQAVALDFVRTLRSLAHGL